MTDDRSLERSARQWLEHGPTRAPDRPVDAALARIQSTAQERDLRIPWRPRTMFDRLAVAAVAAVLAIGTITLTTSLLTRPADPAAGACPPTQQEANAVDGLAPGVGAADRAWERRDAARIRPDRIAAFASEPPDNVPGTVFLLDPVTGSRCRLIALASNHPIQGPFGTSLDWSPSGDALALGLAGAEGPEGQEDGVVLVWTPDRLIRVWSGEGNPFIEWAPDARRLAVWTGSGAPEDELRIVHADGSPDRTLGVRPYGAGLLWSPDGSRMIVSEAIPSEGTLPDTAFSIVDADDGRVTPLGAPGTGHFLPIAWLDDDRVVVASTARGRSGTEWFVMSTSDPADFAELPIPDHVPNHAVPSPDRTRLAYVADADEGSGVGSLSLISLAEGGPAQPTHPAPGLRAGGVGVAWSPDGQQLVFIEAFGPLWTVNADGSNLRQIASGGLVPIDDPWQPVPVR
jgi:hypothetical protein